MTAYELINQPKQAEIELKLAAKTLRQLFRPHNLDKIKNISSFLAKKEHLFVLGKGQSYPAALEIALKIKEVSYLHAEGYPSGELKHGPIALIEKGTPCLVLVPQDETYADMISSAMEVKARGALVIGISPRDNPVFDYFLKAPDCQNASIIVNVVIGQLIAYYTALRKGFDPDMPRNLAKSVTVK
jgi:glucosamine--fructose-6-phosphate aminotransferase (isomerizing)